MKKDDQESPEIIVPLGQALKDARLTVPLSIDEVAEKLNLSTTAVRDIEENLVQILETKKYPIIYLRGYLANYAKLVGLSTLELFVEYQQLAVVQKSNRALPHSKLIMPHPKKRSKLLPFTLLAVVIVGAGFYFSQESASPIPQQPLLEQTEQTEQAEQVPVVASSSESTTLNIEVKEQPVTLELAEQTATLAVPSVDTTDVVADENIVSPVETAIEAPTTLASEVIAEVTPEVAITAPEVEIVTAVPVVETANTEGEVVATELVAETSAEKVEPAVTSQSLSLSFSAECWTEVFDATGKRVAYGLYKAGRVLELSGVAPFQLKLGDPSVVEIQYNDQLIEGDFTPGRTARFNVPLS